MVDLAHGDYKLVVKGNMIHCYPSGGFNGAGIIALRQQILAKAPQNEPWALFEHPFSEAGLTPEGVEELCKSYLEFENAGCRAIAVEVNAMWQHVIQKQLKATLSIPILFDNKPQVLETNLSNILAIK